MTKTKSPVPSPLINGTAESQPLDAAPPATDAPPPPAEYVAPTQWIVKPGTGLIRVAADEARGLIDDGRARVAAPRDLDIAGVSDS